MNNVRSRASKAVMKQCAIAVAAFISTAVLLLAPATAEAQEAAVAHARSPLQVHQIALYNESKIGKTFAGASDQFEVSKVTFVGFEVTFKNEALRGSTQVYEVEAVYIDPDGRTLGGVADAAESVDPSQRYVTFKGRVGNSHGGAFRSGTYTIKFYLSGDYVAQKSFTVLDRTK